jgi:peptidyl-prolyl cis-trans isomerase B (cyclophilin B)
MRPTVRTVSLLILSFCLGTLAAGAARAAQAKPAPAKPAAPPAAPAKPAARPASPAKGAGAKDEVAILKTNLGSIVIRFFPDVAPNHVANFKTLAKNGVYDGTKFHRVMPGFMIQGGDPNSKNDDRADDGMGGAGPGVKAEFSSVHHRRGIVSMARRPDPDSATSQFFIMVADNAGLDGKYSVFGEVLEGMDVVDKIVNLPRDRGTENPLPANPAIIESVKFEMRVVPPRGADTLVK